MERTRFVLLGIPLFLLANACAGKREQTPVAEAWPPEAPAYEAPAPEGAVNPVAQRLVLQFRQQVEGLPEQVGDPAHTAEIRALWTLSDCIDALYGQEDGEGRQASEKIRAHARAIERSGPTALEHAEWTREALLTAIEVIEAEEKDRADLQEPILLARNVIESIRPDVEFVTQTEPVMDAYARVSDVLIRAAEVSGGPGAS